MATNSADILARFRLDIEQTRLAERGRLLRDLARLEARWRKSQDVDAELNALRQRIAVSAAQVVRLREASLRIEYDAGLPIVAHRDEILAAMVRHPVVIVCGATGSGKTTQLPKFCLEAGRGAYGVIAHTQPRRIAARSIAARLAQELGTTVGGAVGYQVRFTERSSPECRVKLMTDGILLREIEGDPDLRRYDTLIIDEAHERSLNIDLLLGALRRLSARRDDLKILITSATIDPGKFAGFFGDAPVIEVSGRSYPVEVRYRPLAGEDEDGSELSLPQGVVAAVEELRRDPQGAGDVLVFLPGEKQIREADQALREARLRDTEILPLYARLSAREQERIFENHHGRRVVLATNVAETSLTVPGVRHVIDSGLARISRYSVRNKVQRLPIEPISQASAEQRKGRCGRVAAGICIRLYGAEDFEAREPFTPPEILRTHLASVILKLAVMGFGDPTEFPFLDPPDLRSINDGFRLLHELKAVDDQRRVTQLGRQVAGLPVDPRLARMLLAADHHRCLAEMLIVSAFLSIQDPRERPADAQQQADRQHASDADARSDFITVLTLWQRFHEQAEALSGNQLRRWCKEQFLSFVRMREWQELHAQLSEAIGQLELRVNQVPASYAELHQALLTGFLGYIGQLEENREYLGARGTHFVIAPGTPLASKPPKWLVAGSLVETTRTYARMVAAVEPQWIEAAGAHLLKRSYSEPHWQSQRGYVAAFESTSLYGLVLSARRRINYASVAPAEAREIFVRAALVEGASAIEADFLRRNRALQAEIESIEAKIRRRDLLIDEQAQVDFYLRQLPPNVHSITALQRLLQTLQGDLALQMARSDLMRRELRAEELQGFPDALTLAGNSLRLTYKFEPAEADDGITLTVPEPLLSQLSPPLLATCVPGILPERTVEILRALPKELRKRFVPVPTYAAQAMQAYRPGEDVYEFLSEWMARQSGMRIAADELAALALPPHLRVNVRVVDLGGKVLAEGRDLRALQRDVRPRATTSLPAATSGMVQAWNFGELPVTREVLRGGVRFTAYPSLEDRGTGVVPIEARFLPEAEQALSSGVMRLAILALPQQYKFIRAKFAQQREILLLGQGSSGAKPLADALAERVFRETFVGEGASLPRDADGFARLIDAGRGRLDAAADTLIARVLPIFQERRMLRQRLETLRTPTLQPAVAELQAQLAALLPVDFLSEVPNPWFGHLPRYLKAMNRRLERLPANPAKDAALAQQARTFADALAQLLAERHGRWSPELSRLRWMIEEYRVSLFAQDLRTSLPVSEKRLREQLETARREIV